MGGELDSIAKHPLLSKTILSDILTIAAGLYEAYKVTKGSGDPNMAITIISAGVVGIWGRIRAKVKIKGL